MDMQNTRKNQVGFTLIELVVVITILGILAAIALPKFAALQAEARVAKMNAALGSIKAAATMAHAQLLASGSDANFTGTPTPAIVIEGTTVVYTNGYPDATTILPLAGMPPGTTDYVVSGLTAPRVAAADANHTGVGSLPDCTVMYTAAAANSQPTYGSNATTATCN
jgi:MSHA pilin protein MshA